MKGHFICIYPVVLIFVVQSCNEGNPILTSKQQAIIKVMEQLEINIVENKNYLVVPINGCSGCRDEVLSFIHENNSDPKKLYVITGTEPKLFRQILREKYYQYLIFDGKGSFIKNGIVSGFPVLFSFANNMPENIKTLYAPNLTTNLDSLRSVLPGNK